jgi:hypothetical protein
MTGRRPAPRSAGCAVAMAVRKVESSAVASVIFFLKSYSQTEKMVVHGHYENDF